MSQGDGGGTAAGEGARKVRVLPAGPHALLVELADGEHAEAFHAELLRRRERGALPGVREIVPGARTVLLDGIEERGSSGGRVPTARDRLARDLLSWPVPPPHREVGDAVEIPVVYDGPDLSEVAALWGVGADEVSGLHSRTAFRVAFCGFAPGFGYLTGLPEHLHVPRRATPRTKVPAGALALAGPYTGVYPRPSPGGWQLIGRMVDPGALWDPGREPAALLGPGTAVRFVPVAPVPPSRAEVPSAPSRAEVPSVPSRAEAASAPSRAEAPQAPSRAEAPQAPSRAEASG
ncbi:MULTISPECIES: carboxyltransferase domain-containing protein [unclassified Streptomyces]|uniref:5-oxoprolinase subunit B family protein n=1 Tax=unclassified Streptomyces TaxID=2593676 RepID=UPI00344DF701